MLPGGNEELSYFSLKLMQHKFSKYHEELFEENCFGKIFP